MLTAIRAAQVAVAAVLVVEKGLLLLEDLPVSGRIPRSWGHLAEVLDHRHRPSRQQMSWDKDYGFGPVAIPYRRRPCTMPAALHRDGRSGSRSTGSGHYWSFAGRPLNGSKLEGRLSFKPVRNRSAEWRSRVIGDGRLQAKIYGTSSVDGTRNANCGAII